MSQTGKGSVFNIYTRLTCIALIGAFENHRQPRVVQRALSRQRGFVDVCGDVEQRASPEFGKNHKKSTQTRAPYGQKSPIFWGAEQLPLRLLYLKKTTTKKQTLIQFVLAVARCDRPGPVHGSCDVQLLGETGRYARLVPDAERRFGRDCSDVRHFLCVPRALSRAVFPFVVYQQWHCFVDRQSFAHERAEVAPWIFACLRDRCQVSRFYFTSQLSSSCFCDVIDCCVRSATIFLISNHHKLAQARWVVKWWNRCVAISIETRYTCAGVRSGRTRAGEPELKFQTPAQDRRQRGDQWCPAPPYEICAPHFKFGILVAAYIQYSILKMCPPLLFFGPSYWFLAPLLLATGLLQLHHNFFGSGSWTIWSIETENSCNICTTRFSQQNMSVEPEPKFQAPVPPSKFLAPAPQSWIGALNSP